jgi:hypothetical protein
VYVLFTVAGSGVPDIFAEHIDNPVGNAPPLTETVYGPVPPFVTIAVLVYAA